MKKYFLLLLACLTLPLAAKNYNVVVTPGENIQKAIEKAPEHPDKPFVILIKNYCCPIKSRIANK